MASGAEMVEGTPVVFQPENRYKKNANTALVPQRIQTSDAIVVHPFVVIVVQCQLAITLQVCCWASSHRGKDITKYLQTPIFE